MKTLAVITRDPKAIQDYLGFGARDVGRGRTKFGDCVVLIEVPDEHAQWQAARLASGLHGAHIVDDLDHWKHLWGFSEDGICRCGRSCDALTLDEIGECLSCQDLRREAR